VQDNRKVENSMYFSVGKQKWEPTRIKKLRENKIDNKITKMYIFNIE